MLATENTAVVFIWKLPMKAGSASVEQEAWALNNQMTSPRVVRTVLEMVSAPTPDRHRSLNLQCNDQE